MAGFAWFKIGADGTAWKRAMAGFRKDAQKLAADINKDSQKAISKNLKRAIGPIAAATTLGMGVKSATTDAKSLRDRAAASALSIQEQQAAEIATKQFGDTSNVTAEQFAEAVQKIIESGQIMSTEMVNSLADARNEWEAAATSLNQTLSPALVNLAKSTSVSADFVNRLIAGWSARLSTPLADMFGSKGNKAAEDAYKAEGDRQDYESRIQTYLSRSTETATGASKDPNRFNKYLGKDQEEAVSKAVKEDKMTSQGRVAPPNGDELQRRGLFVGGPPIALLTVNKQQLAKLTSIDSRLLSIEQGIKDI